MPLDASMVLAQWAVGGMAFCWVTTRHRVAGIGYGWLCRIVYGVMAAGSLVSSTANSSFGISDFLIAAMLVVLIFALGQSIVRRSAGVSGAEALKEQSRQRVDEMLGSSGRDLQEQGSTGVPEFDPRLDLFAAFLGLGGLVALGLELPSIPVAVLRLVVGSLFLGVVSDAMLLGHWYLTQPGLPRWLLSELVGWLLRITPVEVVVLLLPTGMVSVFTGAVDDGWKGTLGYMWIACAITTFVLAYVTRLALRERYYSAVMAATGLLYLAILTAFGTDLVARAVLS